MRRLPEAIMRAVSAQHQAFIAELEALGYSDNTRDTYDKCIHRFVRWLEARSELRGARAMTRAPRTAIALRESEESARWPACFSVVGAAQGL
jgi:site-specific recombinase XerD